MAEEPAQAVRLMNFVSEEQLDQAKRTRGARVEDGTLQRDKTLYEILKENKDKKDAEFNERFKHRPPKALDEEEMEFLDNLETQRKAYERQMADEEAEQLRSFQAAVTAQSTFVQEPKEPSPAPPPVEKGPTGKRNSASRPLNVIIKVKPQPKKAKVDEGSVKAASEMGEAPVADSAKSSPIDGTNKDAHNSQDVSAKTGLVSYSDESEDDD